MLLVLVLAAALQSVFCGYLILLVQKEKSCRSSAESVARVMADNRFYWFLRALSHRSQLRVVRRRHRDVAKQMEQLKNEVNTLAKDILCLPIIEQKPDSPDCVPTGVSKTASAQRALAELCGATDRWCDGDVRGEA